MLEKVNYSYGRLASDPINARTASKFKPVGFPKDFYQHYRKSQ